MTSLQSFEDVHAWQKGRELAHSIYRATDSCGIGRDFALRDQLRRAALSVVSNIAEGFERTGGGREFRHFLSMAKGSTGEIRSQLYVALDAGLLSQVDFDRISAMALETGRLIGGFMRYLEERK
jgi:four helix bundle protein